MIKDKLKWIVLAAWAGVMALLALVYGKRTGTVLRAAIQAHNARAAMLNQQIEIERERLQKVEKEQVNSTRARLVKLEAEREKIRARRQELSDESGDLPSMSDADLARHDNRRRAVARSG